MKMRFSVLVLLLLSACAPAAQAIQTAIAQTRGTIPTATPTLLRSPFPASINLPGGLIVPLKPQEHGEWEVCRAYSLPWTIESETALRSLEVDDLIKITMSNYDIVIYKFKSIQQVPSSEIITMANNPREPCLLVVLFKNDTDTVWVVRATP